MALRKHGDGRVEDIGPASPRMNALLYLLGYSHGENEHSEPPPARPPGFRGEDQHRTDSIEIEIR